MRARRGQRTPNPLAQYDLVVDQNTGRLRHVSDPPLEAGERERAAAAATADVDTSERPRTLTTPDGRTFTAEEQALIADGLGRDVGF